MGSGPSAGGDRDFREVLRHPGRESTAERAPPRRVGEAPCAARRAAVPVWRPAFQSGAPGAGREPDSGSPPAAPPPHARCRHRGATFLSRRGSAGRRPRLGTPVSRPARAVLRTAHGATPIRGDDPSLGVNLNGPGRAVRRSTGADGDAPSAARRAAVPVWRPAFQSGAPGAGREPDSGSPPAAPPPHARCPHRGATFRSRRGSAGRRPRPGTPVSRPARAVLRTAHGATPIRGDDPSLGVNLNGPGRAVRRSTGADGDAPSAARRAAVSMGFEKWTGMGSENLTLFGLETVLSGELGGRGSAGLPRTG